MQVYEEITDLIASGATPGAVADAEASPPDSFMKLVLLMQLIKARARSYNPY